ncbi:SprT-like domain-containing protein [Neisseria arctica]|uniref:SprT-like domain-containing protein n=1 Tax=Neisseria arctica TaxID=1470200 RepID=UPI00069999BC|nr:SprT-like domain-containing protein [Neisseria arctica]UOO85719.1 SprT-like domain-containing protein [Neisseria arctica]
MKPTMQMYTFIQDAYDFFNDRLFAGQLPACLLTLQRDSSVMGYFSNNRWQKGKDEETVHEIALNPQYFITHRPLELMQTLVHEMVHLWQHEFGKPSHRTYHNKEWADKMESIGLMPSSTGEPGGKRTGQRMSDYPIKNGAFYLQCIVFSKMGYKLPFYDRCAKTGTSQVRNNDIEQLMETSLGAAALIKEITLEETVPEENTGCTFDSEEDRLAELSLIRPFSEQFDIDVVALSEKQELEAAAKRKATYLCQSCGDKAWGKPSLDLWCGKCKIAFVKLNGSDDSSDSEEMNDAA